MSLYIALALSLYLLYRLYKADADLTVLFKEKFGKKISSLRGQVVWITGASSGIGEYLAYELAKCGVKLALSGTNVENLEKVKQKCIECGPLGDSDVLLKPFDITDFDSFSSHVEAVINHFGKVDILVNNAGRSQRAGFETIDLPVDEAMFKTNVFGAIHLTRLMVPHFKKQGRGHVVVTSSLAGKMGAPGSATYSGTKFALHGYFECMRAELGPYNIDVSMLCPGPVFSNILEKAYTGKENEQLGGKMKAGERRMSTDRCSHLCAVAIANKLDEVWIAQNPVLILFYLSQYLPTIYRKTILKYFFTKEFASKLREGKF